jgi:hypothetical protein
MSYAKNDIICINIMNYKNTKLHEYNCIDMPFLPILLPLYGLVQFNTFGISNNDIISSADWRQHPVTE